MNSIQIKGRTHAKSRRRKRKIPVCELQIVLQSRVPRAVVRMRSEIQGLIMKDLLNFPKKLGFISNSSQTFPLP